jgi:hypothetical protein
MIPRRLQERLEKTLARLERDQGIDQERLRRWVSFLAICGVLERALADGLVGTYYIKGGVAMELRFAQRARATKDLDIGIEGTRASRLQTLSEVLKMGFDQFTFRVKPRTRDMVAGRYRSHPGGGGVQTRSWQTIDVDLGPATFGHTDLIEPKVHGLAELGIPVTSPVRCLKLADQVAQKLHACTGPFSLGRARDILDIILIDTLGELDYAATAEVARSVFNLTNVPLTIFHPRRRSRWSGDRNSRHWREISAFRSEPLLRFKRVSMRLWRRQVAPATRDE